MGRERHTKWIRLVIADAQEAVLDVVVDVVRPDAVGPAISIETHSCVDLLRAPAPRRRLVVNDDCLVAVMDLMPAGSEAETEIYVLETVQIGVVEAARLLEGLPPNEHARSRDTL